MIKVNTVSWQMVGLSTLFLLISSSAIAHQQVVVVPLKNSNSNSSNSNSSWVDGAGVVSTTAQVGIGTADPGADLEVAGGIKIGNDSSVCGSSQAGIIRWTGSTFEGCNGIKWILLSPIPTVYSSGHEWMDRNLGASRVATSASDPEAYGDLYQWGRFADGHEKRTSTSLTGQSNDVDPGHSFFLIGHDDWLSTPNEDLWQGSGINNPCPAGFRLPTVTELMAERASWVSDDAAGAFTSPTKLVMAGHRGYSSGNILNAGSTGWYWSSTIRAVEPLGPESDSYFLLIDPTEASGESYRRGDKGASKEPAVDIKTEAAPQN